MNVKLCVTAALLGLILAVDSAGKPHKFESVMISLACNFNIAVKYTGIDCICGKCSGKIDNLWQIDVV